MLLKMTTRLSGLAVLLSLLALFFGACVTTVNESDIPQDLSPAIFFQRAQEFVDREQWQAATTYLTVFKARYPNDIAHNLEADYLIAQIEYKQGHLAEARNGYQALLDRYTASDAASLPEWIKILSARLLTRIDEKDPKAKDAAEALKASPVPSADPAQNP